VRTVIYQYQITVMRTLRKTGRYWQRRLLGNYGPPLTWDGEGNIVVGSDGTT
jgi:hypothetical protein